MPSVEEVLRFVGQYGLSAVLLILLAYAYDRKERRHEADRAKWDEERRSMLEAWGAERQQHYAASKAEGERLAAMLLEAHKQSTSIVNAANDMSTAFAEEKREIRDRELRERDLREREAREARDTGRHAPPRLPPRGSRE